MDDERNGLINRYKAYKAEYGRPPSSREYFAYTGISERKLHKAFGSNAFSKLASECGDVPNDFFEEKVPLEEIFRQWGELFRKEYKLPTQADWMHYRCSPTPNRILANYGIKWTNLPLQFLEYAKLHPEWNDISPLISVSDSANNDIAEAIIDDVIDANDYVSFLPRIIANMDQLSENEDMALEFEKKVNLAFQLFGYEVDDLGQGTGRNPDGIAKDKQYHYAIIIDAKARKEKYSVGTEDRKFIEYIRKYQPLLKKEGYEYCFFLVVSSNFSNIGNAAIDNIYRETQVKLSFISSINILKLLSYKIQYPRNIDLGTIKDLFINGGLVSDKTVQGIIQKRKQ